MRTFNLKNLIRPNVANMKPYTSARDEYMGTTSEMVFLDANENPYNNGINRYPDPNQKELKNVLAKLKDISPYQLLLGNGSDEILDLIFRAFCEPGKDNIITLPPTYGMYAVLADTNNIDNRRVFLTTEFKIDVEKILNTIDGQTKLIFLCSPNNPTGNLLDIKDIEFILNSFNGLVIIDEAYIDFSLQHSWISKLEEFPNLVVTQTLSKAYAAAGIRLGICYASKEIIKTLQKIKPPYNVNLLTQEHALSCILNQKKIQRHVDAILNERNKLLSALTEIKCVKKAYPTSANFVLVKMDDATTRYNQLLKAGIVVRNRSNQPLCEDCLRFTIGTPEENNKLIKALKEMKQ
ncbi:histidinol-phosphate transaminase [Leptobacterium sp. I13]|uniref:histidinol-phosphate transaminase n=1 Tax=Leptobacterium meishanense TaxID=3128904 RepID=UPI0030EB41FA